MPEFFFPFASKNRQIMQIEENSDRYNDLERIRSMVEIDRGNFSREKALGSPQAFPLLLADLLERNPYLLSALSHEKAKHPDDISAVIIPSLDLILADSPLYGPQAIIVQLACTRNAIRRLFWERSVQTSGYGVFTFPNAIPESISTLYETESGASSLSILTFDREENDARNFLSAEIQGCLATSLIVDPNYVAPSPNTDNSPVIRYIPGPPSLRIPLEMPKASLMRRLFRRS